MFIFERSNFYIKKKKISPTTIYIRDILRKLISESDKLKDHLIDDICSPERLFNNSVLFVHKFVDLNETLFENILVITDNEEIYNKYKLNKILVKDLSSAYNIIANELYIHDDKIEYFDEFEYVNKSHISKFAKIHDSVKIFNGCTIGRGVEIGKNCIIKNNVIIKNSILSDNIIISDNTTIGSSGFGFDLKNMGAQNLNPQIGIVYIDSNTYIGSNCTIDRGKIDMTFIGKNNMIDNMVHIAHNVQTGDNVCIAAQTGISGSVKIGSNVVIGGQVGFAGHIKIGNNVVVAAKSGVTKDIKDNQTIAGFPATDIKSWRKKIINEKKYGHK